MRASTLTLSGTVLSEGSANGRALVLDEPLSFWGGFDPRSGRVVDQHHPQRGCELVGSIVVLAQSRGSAGTPGGLAEAIRLGTAPAGILLAIADVNLAVGSLVAAQLYAKRCPVVALGSADYEHVQNGDSIDIEDGGVVKLTRDVPGR